jgi:hypothetical protein
MALLYLVSKKNFTRHSTLIVWMRAHRDEPVRSARRQFRWHTALQGAARTWPSKHMRVTARAASSSKGPCE